MLERVLLVAIGAGVGGAARYLVAMWAADRLGAAFPWGTLIIDVSGSFLLGFLVVLTTERLGLRPEVRLLLGTGFCGGYTTFSTFAVETLELTNARSEPAALLNVVLSVGLSLLGAVAGAWLARLG